MVCADMKLTRLEDVRDALEGMAGRVTVPLDVADAARASLERMTAIG